MELGLPAPSVPTRYKPGRLGELMSQGYLHTLFIPKEVLSLLGDHNRALSLLLMNPK